VLPSFNTAGVCIPGEHYMLPPERRLGRVMQLIDERKFFTLQSGRQTGKTTSARWLARHYNEGRKYRAIWVDIQTAREEPDPAAAFRTVIEKLDLPDRTLPVTAEHVEAAKETIIRERRTYIDSLAAKLREPRVRRIIDAMLAGDRTPGDMLDDDFAYVLGLGLIRAREGHYEIANPIYREVVPRALTFIQQMQIANEPASYMRPDGALDLVIDWRGKRHVIEVKLRRDTQTEKRAFEQIARYLDTLGLDEGWLIMFDLRARRSWKQRLTSKTSKTAGKRIHVIGC
jgi:hypothetical protein